MGWLFLTCLIAFVVFKMMKGQKRHAVRESSRSVLEPLFNDKYAEFFILLEVPLLPDVMVTRQEAYLCGRHIMVYLADNPDEAKLFLSSVLRYPESVDVVESAYHEVMAEHIQEVRLTAYRSIAFIMSKYKHPFFQKVDLEEVRKLVRAAEGNPGALFLPTGKNTTLEGWELTSHETGNFQVAVRV